MKYYMHDTNAFNDEKITMLYLEFGYEGLGLFYTLLEKVALQEKPVNTQVLKAQLKVGKKLEKCWKFMESIGLIHSNNGETFNKQLLNFSEKYTIKKEKNAERIRQWRESQEVTKDVTHYESVRNASKVKRSKENRSKENKEIPALEVFYEYAKANKPNVSEEQVRLKYQAWVENGWQTGKGKPIKNWKSTLLNTLPFFSEVQSTNGKLQLVH